MVEKMIKCDIKEGVKNATLSVRYYLGTLLDNFQGQQRTLRGIIMGVPLSKSISKTKIS